MPNHKNTERDYWSDLWREARRNMPRVSPKRRGSPTVLRKLLGYEISVSEAGKLGSAQHCYTAENRGDKPKDPRRQEMLKALAGPYGTTLAKAMAIQQQLDLSKFKYWPDGKGGFIESKSR